MLIDVRAEAHFILNALSKEYIKNRGRDMLPLNKVFVNDNHWLIELHEQHVKQTKKQIGNCIST